MSATKEFKIGDQVNVTLKGVIVGKQKQTLFLADDDLTINGKDEYRVCLINADDNAFVYVDIPADHDEEPIPMEKKK